MTEIRLAVVGTGDIGRRHIALIQAEPQCHLAAIADPATATATLAAEAGVPHYADFHDLLHREAVDGVIIATPNALHETVGLACAERRLPMLVEKPIAESIAAGSRLLEAAASTETPVAVGHMRRFDPAVEKTKAILDSGQIGKLRAVSVLWAARKSESYYDVGWRVGPGGGPVLINLIHDVDMLRALCGEIENVYAETTGEARAFDVEDTAAIILRFRSGALGTITLSDAAPSPWTWEAATGENPAIPSSGENCYRFLGSKAALDYPNLVLWSHAEGEAGCWSDPISPNHECLDERASLAAQLRQFCRVVRGEEAPRVSGAEGLATLAATVAIRDSAASGHPVAPTFTLSDDTTLPE